MARRERRAYPQRSVRSEQRRQTAQSASGSPTRQPPLFPSSFSALRVAPLLVLACVAPWPKPKSAATRSLSVFQQAPQRREVFEAVRKLFKDRRRFVLNEIVLD